MEGNNYNDPCKSSKLESPHQSSMKPDSEGLHAIANTDRPDLQADIVFVHGVGGSSHSTWRHGKEGKPGHFFWPEELGRDLPHCGIWCAGYPAGFTALGKQGMIIEKRAGNLSQKLANAGLGVRPLFFVTHSMGGLIVKHLIVDSLILPGDDRKRIVSQIHGIVFCGTPHRGSGFSDAARVFGILGGGSQAHVDEMRSNADQLDLLHDKFVEWQRQNPISILSFAENRKLSLTRWLFFATDYGVVVPRASANPGIQGCDIFDSDDDHLTLVKPRNRHHDVYAGVKRFIEKTLISGVQRAQSSISNAVKRIVTQLEIVLDQPLDRFNENEFKTALRGLLGADVENVRIVSIRAGSTIVKLGAANEILQRIVDQLRLSNVALREFVLKTRMISLAWNENGEDFRFRVSEAASRERTGATDAAPHIWNIPRLRNPYFTGREKSLENLRQALVSDNAAALTQAISGLGGIGKTQIATEYAYRYKDKYDVVWWVRSEDKATLSNDYAALALKLDLPQKEVSDQTVVIAAVRDWLNGNKGWLLIFDNAKEAADIRHFVPQAQSGHVIITSRKTEWEEVAQGFPLRDFERDESVKYLFKRTGSNDLSAANDLAEELSDFPLALAQAAAYINSARKTITDYLSLFRSHKAELLTRQAKDSGYPFTITTTWSLSLDQAKKLTPLAEDLLKLMAFFAPDSIPRDLLREGLGRMKKIDDLGFDDAVGALQTNSLIEAVSDSLSVHRLVQFVTSEQMEAAEKKAGIQTVVQLMDGAFSSLDAPPHDVRSWPKCAVLLPHAGAVISIAEEASTISVDLSSLMNWCGMHWYGRANYADGEPLCRRALKIHEAHLGADHPDVATSLNNLAILLKAQGKYDEAEPLYRRALTIREAHLGADHPDVATSLNNLAALLRVRGEYANAEPLYRRALKIREAHLGADHPDVAGSLNNLAMLLQDQGEYADAEPLFRRALKIHEAHLGADHPDVATSLNNLAILLQDQEKYADAEPLIRRALKIREAHLGADHPDVAGSLNNLALLLKAQEKYDEAEPLFRRALKIYEAQLGADHPDVATSLNNLAMLLQDQGEYADAEPLFRRSLKIREAHLGADHPDVATSLNNLAASLGVQGEYANAELLFRRALKIHEAQLGADHPTTRTVRKNLEAMLDDWKRKGR